jgi:hypothetical protein
MPNYVSRAEAFRCQLSKTGDVSLYLLVAPYGDVTEHANIRAFALQRSRAITRSSGS